MHIGPSNSFSAYPPAIVSSDVIAQIGGASYRNASQLIRSVDRGERLVDACGDRAVFARCDWYDPCDAPLPPFRYDQYLVVRNRADRDVREGIGPGCGCGGGCGCCCTDNRGHGPRPAPAPCGGGGVEDGPRPLYAMPRIGEEGPGTALDLVRRVEDIYRRLSTLPSGNVLDVFA